MSRNCGNTPTRLESGIIIHHYIINLSSHPWQQQWLLKYLISLFVTERLSKFYCLLTCDRLIQFTEVQQVGQLGLYSWNYSVIFLMSWQVRPYDSSKIQQFKKKLYKSCTKKYVGKYTARLIKSIRQHNLHVSKSIK